MQSQNPEHPAVTALYLLHCRQHPALAKVGIVRTPYESLPTVLKRVRARVRAAIPGEAPLRVRDLPPADVWVTLCPIPRLLREVESYVVIRLGSPRHDPLRQGRKEFIDARHLPLAQTLIGVWQSVLPEFLSEPLHSADGGNTYTVPESLGQPAEPRHLRELSLQQVAWCDVVHRPRLAQPSQRLLPLLVTPTRRLEPLTRELVAAHPANDGAPVAGERVRFSKAA